MNKEQVKGYLLEVVVEKLIRINGYEVITKSNNDDIIEEKKVLKLKGRGGYHQFDSLGNFKITPPFIYSLRLFVEAKAYSKGHKVGIDLVRMGIGFLQDVNTNYFAIEVDDNELMKQRYDYHYAIFSLSGFTEGAQRLALAHKLYLVDIKYKYFLGIEEKINKLVDKVFGERKTIEYEELNQIIECIKNRGYYIDKWITDENELNKMKMLHGSNGDFHELYKLLAEKSLYIANFQNSQIMAFMPSDDDVFRNSMIENNHQEVSVTWENEEIGWIITPTNNKEYTLNFNLPNLFALDWRESLRKSEDKFEIISFVAYLDNENPTLCTLKFNIENTIENIYSFEKDIKGNH